MAAVAEGRVPGLPHFDVKFTTKNFDKSAHTLIRHVKKKWKVENLRRTTFDFGITNQLVGYYVEDGETKMTSQYGEHGRSEMILFRVYGNKTELLIDRAKELRNFQVLGENALAAPLYCTFENGYCYGFIEGKVLTREDLRDPTLSKYNARLVARLHSIKLQEEYLLHIKRENNIFETITRLLSLVPKGYEASEKQARFKNEIPTVAQLRAEVEVMQQATKGYLPDNVFCHNDLLCANFIFNEYEDKMYCIDYEYAGPGYAMYDVGNHFNEFAGIQTVDYSHYPSKQFQLDWLRVYLEEYKLLTGQPKVCSDKEVEHLYLQANQFSLLSHLYWGIWSLIQAYNSEIEFDYIGYAILRLNEYFKQKTERLNLSKILSK